MDRIKRRIADNHAIAFSYGQDVVDLIVSRCNEVASGGPDDRRHPDQHHAAELSIKLLEHQMAGEAITAIDVGVGEGGFTYEFHGAADVRRQRQLEATS